MDILPAHFYEQPTLQLAESLLGKLLVHETIDGPVSGYIVETEAYMGPLDQAAHSFGGRKTKRTEIMFREPGHIYTYQMHTHTLINVVAEQVGEPHAILIRAVEPVDGLHQMRARRNELPMKQWTNGPGKLTKAMGITMAHYGKLWYEPPLFIAEGKQVSAISTGPRIGIDNAGEAVHYPYRFWETGNPYVSKYRTPKKSGQ